MCRTVDVAPGRHARARLRALSDRVPHLADDPYRIAMNRLGLDAPTPAEAALRGRLVRGGYRSRGLVADACLIALVDTGVGVWAVDAVDELRIEDGCVVGPGVRVPLFVAPPRVSGSRVTFFGVVVPGVAAGVVEEAVWIAADIVAA